MPTLPFLSLLALRRCSLANCPALAIAWAALIASATMPAAPAAQVTLTWQDNANNESGFRIERATGTGSYSQIAAVGADTTTYLDTAVSASSSYTYRVYAYNSIGNSAFSNTVSVTTGAAGNTAPTISNIVDRTINEDATTDAIPFSVGDAESVAGSLTISASSSNPTLVPNSGIVFSGSGTASAVVVTPAANQNGSATLTITVSDGTLTATDTFVLTVSAVNDSPTISNVANQTINQGTATTALALTVGDVETAAGSLTLTGSSSNTTLVPNSAIVFGGTGANRTVTVTPVATQSGTATITLRASDGALAATDTFTLTVNAIAPSNTAPTISDIASRTINEDATTGPVAFTVGDAQMAAGSLTVSGSSSNTSLVPNSAIVFGGTGSNRTITVSPAANQAGSATITVRVSDGALTTSDTFALTVTAVNDAPAIANLANRTINEDDNTGAIAFTISDAETAVGNLTLAGSSSNTSLVPNGAIVFGGSGANRTITVSPAANHNGTTTITVTVSDGTITASDAFTLTVTAVNDAPALSSVADQTFAPGMVTSAINLTIGDVETAANDLTVAATSSNTTLVPNTAIVFGGSGANRTVTVTPVTTQTGSAMITLTVSDGSLVATDAFNLTVTAVAPTNTAPTISSIADQTITAGSSSGPIAFTIGDAETSTSSLTLIKNASNLALVPLENITFGGSGSNRTITIQPVPDVTGWSTIWVKVTDGELEAFASFILTVQAPPAESTPPSVTITSPTSSANIAAGSILPIIASLSGDTSQLARVEFYDGAVKLGETTTTPHTFIWTAATPGTHALSARAVNTDGASTSSVVVTLEVLPGSQLVNLSTRGLVRADEPMITGLVLSGNGRQRVLLRAVGHTLESFGVTGVVEQPLISIVRPGADTVIVETTDGWEAGGNLEALITAMTSTGAFPLATGSQDAAVLIDLEPGLYTAVIRDGSRKGGVCLVEAYIVEDGVTSTASTLINLSTRGAVGRNDNMMIAGLVISGTQPKRVLVRGIGPALAAFGVPGVLTDPMVRIFSSADNTTPIATNDDWDETTAGATAVAAESTATGAFALGSGSADAAMVITLAPGAYTVQLSAARGNTGTGLIEVYTLSE